MPQEGDIDKVNATVKTSVSGADLEVVTAGAETKVTGYMLNTRQQSQDFVKHRAGPHCTGEQMQGCPTRRQSSHCPAPDSKQVGLLSVQHGTAAPPQ